MAICNRPCCRSVWVERGEKGVRCVCLLTTGIPEIPLIDEVWEIHGKAHGITFEQFHAIMEGTTHRKRLITLKELAMRLSLPHLMKGVG